ncbi:MAG TPA: hypothetical protein VK579_20450, partial [Terriglobales bacterium]|nr:hypothetical protein [Terriglobales bacterium]
LSHSAAHRTEEKHAIRRVPEGESNTGTEVAAGSAQKSKLMGENASLDFSLTVPHSTLRIISYIFVLFRF